MLETIIMIFGCFAGWLLVKFRPAFVKGFSSANNKLQLICVALIIFIMGINIGTMNDLAGKLASMGLKSVVFAIVPTLFSALLVYALSRKFIVRQK